jgi:hypothetical protein
MSRCLFKKLAILFLSLTIFTQTVCASEIRNKEVNSTIQFISPITYLLFLSVGIIAIILIYILQKGKIKNEKKKT